ncbi:MAG: ExbD/TolR family protein [Planctomycetota bacterium JB042]
MANKAVEEATEEIKMEMTPMIDVTFLLLIFFLCSIKFKVLEGKLQTYLPKDVGVNTTPQQKMLEKVDVRIYRTLTREKLDLEQIENYRKWYDAGGWSEDQVEIRFQGQKVSGLKELKKKFEDLRERIPPPEDPEEDDTLKMNLEAMKGCIYEDIVKVVDVALAAKFTSITFRGIEADA